MCARAGLLLACDTRTGSCWIPALYTVRPLDLNAGKFFYRLPLGVPVGGNFRRCNYRLGINNPIGMYRKWAGSQPPRCAVVPALFRLCLTASFDTLTIYARTTTEQRGAAWKSVMWQPSADRRVAVHGR